MLLKTVLILSCLENIKALLLNQRDLKPCEPIFNCPPEHEIISCLHNAGSNKDICRECKPGFAQPDYISSGMPNVTCFEKKSSCLAADITFQREERGSFCDSLKGCKCKTLLCYYGDPCICDSKSGCPENEHLQQNGECVPCPKGSFKNGTGCGPCLYSSNQSYVNVDVEYPAPIGYSSTEYLSQDTTEHSTSLPGVTGYSINEQSSSCAVLVPLLVVIAFLALVIVVMVIILCQNRRNLSICGSDANKENTRNLAEQMPMNVH